MQALVIGAGNIGLGFLGYLLWKANLGTITFVEAQAGRVATLNRLREYAVCTVSSSGVVEEVVRPVDAVLASDHAAVISAIVNADLLLTAVGKHNLARVAPFIAEGLVERRRRRPRSDMHVIVIACENVYDNTRYLEGLIMDCLLSEEDQVAIQDAVSFPSCMVDRIVPHTSGEVTARHPLAVTVEDYFQFVVDGTALKAAFPAIPGIEVSDALPAKLEQKLFTLNMLHGIVGYWGVLAGYEFVHDAMGDARIAELAQGAFGEVSHVLCKRHPSITPEAQQRYQGAIVSRFRNPHLRDPVTRVAAQPIRKLGSDERLVKPARLAFEDGRLPAHLATGIAAAFRYAHPGDGEAVRLQEMILHEGVDVALRAIAGLEAGNPLTALVRSDYLLSSLR